MCVYSRESELHRDAKQGEPLTLTPFEHAKGFTALGGNPNEAVCLRPGTVLRIEKVPKSNCNRHLIPGFTVTFQERKDLPANWKGRDCIVLFNGEEIALEALADGLEVDVVTIGPEVADKETDVLKAEVPEVAATAIEAEVEELTAT